MEVVSAFLHPLSFFCFLTSPVLVGSGPLVVVVVVVVMSVSLCVPVGVSVCMFL